MTYESLIFAVINWILLSFIKNNETPLKSELVENGMSKTTMEVFIRNKLIFESSRNIVRFIVRSICGVDTSDISLAFFCNICTGSMGLSNLWNK